MRLKEKIFEVLSHVQLSVNFAEPVQWHPPLVPAVWARVTVNRCEHM